MKKIYFIMFFLIFNLNGIIKSDDFIFGKIEQKLDRNKINDVKLSKVLLSPGLFKNSIIRFEAKFIRPGKISRVFHTKYNLSEYLNFSVWPDEVKLWKKNGLKNFLPLAFVKKTSPKATVIGKLKKYQRIRITGLVSNDYQNNAWVEVLSIKVLEKKSLSEDALYHIRLGDKYHYGDKPASKFVDLNVAEDGNKNIGVSLLRAEIEYKKSLSYNLGKVEKAAVYELLGEVQLKQGRVDDAILTLTETLKINEKSGNGNYLMARAYIKKKDLDQAKIFGGRALELMSKNKKVLLCNAEILIGLKKYDLAKHYCINALRLDSEDINIYSNLGVIYDHLGEYDVSKEMYKRAIHLTGGTDKFDLHKNMAHELLKIGLIDKTEKNKALEEANRELDASIHQIYDKDPESFFIWGRVLEEWIDHQNHFESAVEKFSKAINLKSDYYDAYIRKADILSKHLNKSEESMDSYEKASSLKPKELYPLQAVEGIYRKAKKFKKTVSVNERIILIDDKNFEAYFLLGLDNHKHLKDQEKSAEWFIKARSVNPSDKLIDFYVGETQYLIGKKSEAIKSLLLAEKKMKGDDRVCYFLAKAYVDLGQSKNAITYLKKYNEMDSKNIETRVLLVNEYLKNQKTFANALGLSKTTLDMAIKSNNLVGQSRDNYGWSLVKARQTQKAMSVLEKSTKELKTDLGWYHLAFVYVDQDLFDEADNLIKKLKSKNINKKLMNMVSRLENILSRKKDRMKSNKKKDAEKKAKIESENAKKLKIDVDKKKREKASKDKEAARALEKQIEKDKSKQKQNKKVLAKQKKEEEAQNKKAKREKEIKDKEAKKLAKKKDKEAAEYRAKMDSENAKKLKVEKDKRKSEKALKDKVNAKALEKQKEINDAKNEENEKSLVRQKKEEQAKKKKTKREKESKDKELKKLAKKKTKDDKLNAEIKKKEIKEAEKKAKDDRKRELARKKKEQEAEAEKKMLAMEAKKNTAKIAEKEKKKREKENIEKIELEKKKAEVVEKKRKKIAKENAKKEKDAKRKEAKLKKAQEKQAKKEQKEARKNAEKAAKKREETLKEIEKMKKKREKDANKSN
ncbi:MAG: hypothetical protein COA79_11485 [Planctomycetota bacterium]|nr:MAG: hypothetical protein COA79_11485 [Planctomycetota bacterium]